jgi:hypothetical protein
MLNGVCIGFFQYQSFFTSGQDHAKKLKQKAHENHHDDGDGITPVLGNLEGLEQNVCSIPVVEVEIHGHHLDQIYKLIYFQNKSNSNLPSITQEGGGEEEEE